MSAVSLITANRRLRKENDRLRAQLNQWEHRALYGGTLIDTVKITNLESWIVCTAEKLGYFFIARRDHESLKLFAVKAP